MSGAIAVSKGGTPNTSPRPEPLLALPPPKTKHGMLTWTVCWYAARAHVDPCEGSNNEDSVSPTYSGRQTSDRHHTEGEEKLPRHTLPSLGVAMRAPIYYTRVYGSILAPIYILGAFRKVTIPHRGTSGKKRLVYARYALRRRPRASESRGEAPHVLHDTSQPLHYRNAQEEQHP